MVKHGLTKIQKRQVALSIFMEVSVSFESFQRFLSIVTDSGFSQEDLVSNLIGFYIGVGDITQEKAIELCHPVSKQVALSVWDKEGAVGKNKNNNWRPKYANSTVHINSNQCADECLVSGTTFPDVFTKIKPVRKGFLYVNA
ncbi:hypothetical protein ABT56_10975 [Photobacterium aquae]|uniref:Uncharacterized protein n=1 Tax=Photobacterium aquae TaxID=1195763 RepID=A0A0J1H187_9GAMM|nr:hypothetical protein ABT56_10975 [Photobacterium aquae]